MYPPKVKFGDFDLDVLAYQLSRGGRAIKLERIPMDLLLLLVDRRGQLVTRDEIIEKLWGKETFLDTDNSINTAVAKIRMALRDDAEKPAFIKTISGKGYRFIAAVRVGHDEQRGFVASDPVSNAAAKVIVESQPTVPVDTRRPIKPHKWLAGVSVVLVVAAVLVVWNFRDSLRRVLSPARPPVITSLAVLPLENLTGDPSQEYFADGMTDALITDLAQIGALRVISRTSVMRYKGVRKSLPRIAQELGVDGIVEGTVTRSAGKIRITSQLIFAPSDQHLWAHSYERDIGDVVELQADIVQAIGSEVRTALTPEQRKRLSARATPSPSAYEAYLKARYYWNQRTPTGVKKSIEFFQEAIEQDPNFVLAYAGLADAHNFSNILGGISPKESSPEAKIAATQALVLDPQLAEAHAALGLVKSHYDFDLSGAQKEFLKAIDLNRNYANAHLFYAGAYLTPMGRHQDAIAEMQKALQVDPLSVPLNNMLGQTYLWAEDYDKAFQQFQRTIGLDPGFPLVHFFLANLLEARGRYDEAIQEYEKGESLEGVDAGEAATHATELRGALRSGGSRGYWQRNLRITLQAQKQAGPRYFPAIAVAGAYARAGDKENAFRWLERSYEDKEGQSLTLIRWLPEFKSLREDTRFVDLLGRMGLPH